MEFIVVWLLFGLVSGMVASSKGRSGCGWFALGVLLGPFGLLMAFVASKDATKLEQEAVQGGKMKKCPYCAELVRAEAVKCRFCGESLGPPTTEERGDR